MEAIKLDILIDPNGEARRVLDDLEVEFLKAGKSAEDAAKGVREFEKAYKDSTAKSEAKKQLDALRKGHDDAGDAAKEHATQMQALSAKVMQFAGPAVLVAAAKNTLAWADSIDELAKRTKFSVTAVQQMGKVAEQNGSSFQALAGAVQQAEQRLVDGNKKALAAVATMGLSVDELLASKPEDRLRMLAVGLSEIEDPARRSAAEMAIFGRTGDALAPTLDKIAEGADKTKFALGADFIKTGAEAQDMLDDLTSTVMDLGRAFLLLPTTITTAAAQMGKDSVLGTWFESMGFHGSRATPNPKLPGTPGGAGSWMPEGATVPDPFAPGGVGGNSLSFIERALGIKIPRKGAAPPTPVTPYTQNQWANIGAQLAFGANPIGNGGLGGFPGWAIPMNPLGNSMSRDLLGIGFGRNSNPVGYSQASMVSPASLLGGGGNWFTNLFKGKGGNIAGLGMGLLSNLIPGLSRTGSSIGGTIGSLFGPLGSGIGSLLGGGIGRLFGGGGEHRRVNDMRDDFTKQFGGTQELAKLAQEAGTNLDAFFKAKNVKDYEKAIADLVKKFDELGKKKDDIAALNDEIASLTSQTEVSFDDMQAIVEEFGLDINQMGQAFKQAAMDKEAKRIIDAFAVMEKGGADMNGVLDGMKDEISTLVQQSIEFGTTIPSNMKPWIEKLMESGRLVDKDGKAIKDLGGIKFADPIVSEMEKLIKKLDELISKLGGVSDGFGNAEKSAGDFARGAKDAAEYYNNTPETDASYNVSRGGIIGRNGVSYFNRGGFVPMGTDTVPAMLTPGEMVTSAGATKEILKALKQRNVGGGEVTFVMIPNGTDVDAIERRITERLPRNLVLNGPARVKMRRAILGAQGMA